MDPVDHRADKELQTLVDARGQGTARSARAGGDVGSTPARTLADHSSPSRLKVCSKRSRRGQPGAACVPDQFQERALGPGPDGPLRSHIPTPTPHLCVSSSEPWSDSLRSTVSLWRRPASRPVRPLHILMLALGPSERTFVRGECEFLTMFRWSFARRQQYRRLLRAAATGAASLAAGGFAVTAARADATALAGALLLTMVGLLIYARHWLRLAGRSRVGARSEDEVRRVLAPLTAEGWRMRHSLPYRGRGDIDSVAIAPAGFAFAIETKTRTFDARHIASVRDIASWLYRRRRRWCRRGALPVLCVVRARRLERVEDEVLILSLDRLVPVLRAVAGTSQRPAFLADEISRK